jgi:alpha-N-arabinofuranosidase
MSASAKEGSALLSLTNLDAASAHTVEVDLRGAAFDVGRARILTAAQLADHNTAEVPDLVTPQEFEEVKRSRDTVTIELPAHSFVTVDLESVGLDDQR